MKKTLLLFVLVTLTVFTQLNASDNFQAPLPDGGKSISADNPTTVTFLFEKLPFQTVTEFYKGELENVTDIKWHELENKGQVVVYDWGNREWHRINITDKGDGKGVLVSIRKDSWTWIIGTLVIRFIGVFIVLIILMIALYISGSIFSKSKVKTEPKKA